MLAWRGLPSQSPTFVSCLSFKPKIMNRALFTRTGPTKRGSFLKLALFSWNVRLRGELFVRPTIPRKGKVAQFQFKLTRDRGDERTKLAPKAFHCFCERGLRDKESRAQDRITLFSGQGKQLLPFHGYYSNEFRRKGSNSNIKKENLPP